MSLKTDLNKLNQQPYLSQDFNNSRRVQEKNHNLFIVSRDNSDGSVIRDDSLPKNDLVRKLIGDS
jgi:hypothetical protein